MACVCVWYDLLLIIWQFLSFHFKMCLLLSQILRHVDLQRIPYGPSLISFHNLIVGEQENIRLLYGSVLPWNYNSIRFG